MRGIRERRTSRRSLLILVTLGLMAGMLATAVPASADTDVPRTSGEAIHDAFTLQGVPRDFTFTFMARQDSRGVRGSFTWFENGDSTTVNQWQVEPNFFDLQANDQSVPKAGGLAQFRVLYEPGTALADYVRQSSAFFSGFFCSTSPYQYVAGSPVLIQVYDRVSFFGVSEALGIYVRPCALRTTLFVALIAQGTAVIGDLVVKPAPWPKGAPSSAETETIAVAEVESPTLT
jgi:hypothetical protein